MKKEETINNSPEKMDLRSMDVGVDNRARMKALFPSVFTETQNEKGKMVESIDFEKLKAELGTFSDLFEARRERYGMDWPGKKDCMKLLQQPSIATLKPCREESVGFDETENLFIEGDNLEVLKLLQKSYYGRIKMIYIDPPYNTGKEFIYPDNYSETLDTYLAYAGLADDEGRKFSTNTPNEGRFHTKWLNMMYPRLYWGPNLSYQKPRLKRFLTEIQKGVVPSTWWPFNDTGHNDEGQKETGAILGKKIFSTPKPVRLMKRMLEIAVSQDDLVLDFFAGSGATAHAVLGLNNKDGGNRKFIMVQLPEPCDEKSDAFKAGYKTIADIGKERIRRVIEKIEEERAAKAKKAEDMLPGMAEELPELDLGFKVLKLDRSNFKIWDGNQPDMSEEKMVRQLELHIDHIDPNATQEDILFELLLKAGFMPTEKVEKRELADKTVFAIAEGSLLICLENEITRELIDAVAEAEPLQFICLDRGFQGNDQLKANTVQTFAARNQRKDKAEQILFRTV